MQSRASAIVYNPNTARLFAYSCLYAAFIVLGAAASKHPEKRGQLNNASFITIGAGFFSFLINQAIAALGLHKYVTNTRQNTEMNWRTYLSIVTFFLGGGTAGVALHQGVAPSGNINVSTSMVVVTSILWAVSGQLRIAEKDAAYAGKLPLAIPDAPTSDAEAPLVAAEASAVAASSAAGSEAKEDKAPQMCKAQKPVNFPVLETLALAPFVGLVASISYVSNLLNNLNAEASVISSSMLSALSCLAFSLSFRKKADDLLAQYVTDHSTLPETTWRTHMSSLCETLAAAALVGAGATFAMSSFMAGGLLATGYGALKLASSYCLFSEYSNAPAPSPRPSGPGRSSVNA